MKELTVTLERGPNGLGFHIKGGVDDRDHNVTVSTISELGSAAADGRLKVGDRILTVNGKSLEKLTHAEAVEVFRTADDTVTITVLRESEKSDNIWLIGAGTAVVIAATLIVALVWLKTNKQF